jgi:hypothetical protein
MRCRSRMFVCLGALGQATVHMEDKAVEALALGETYVAQFVSYLKHAIIDAERLPLRCEYRGIKLEIDLGFAAKQRLVLVCKLGHSRSYALNFDG